MNLLYGHDASVAIWVAAQIDGCDRGFGNCRAIGVVDGGDLVAGCVYHDWSPEFETIQISCAAKNKRWMTRPVVRGLLAYPFGFCRMVTFQTDADNTARRIIRRLGANEYEIPHLRGQDKSLFILTLSKGDWLNSRFANGKA